MPSSFTEVTNMNIMPVLLFCKIKSLYLVIAYPMIWIARRQIPRAKVAAAVAPVPDPV